MLIETNDYLTIKNFAKKVNTYPSKVWHYVKDERIETIDIDGNLYVHRDLLAKWPPRVITRGRKPKLKE